MAQTKSQRSAAAKKAAVKQAPRGLRGLAPAHGHHAQGVTKGSAGAPVRERSLSSVPDLRERWRTSFIEATTYDWAVEHEAVAGVLGRLLWGTDTAAFYRDIARLSELPTSTRVLDIPCGGG